MPNPIHTEEEELAGLIDRRLKSLPELSAPPTLIHRVMLSVHAQDRLAWWRRSWWSWSLGMRVLALVLLVGCAWVVSDLVSLGVEGFRLGWLRSAVGEALEPLRPVYEVAATLANACFVVCRVGGQQVLLLAAAAVGASYLLTIGLGTACYRVAFQRSHRL
jgi:hypothetical protein